MTGNHQPLLLIGEGNLFNTLVRELQSAGVQTGSPFNPAVPAGTMIISAYDWWDPARDSRLQNDLRAKGCTWLPLWADFSKLWIGPWIFPAMPGCIACVEERKQRLDAYPEYGKASLHIADKGEQRLKRHPLISDATAKLLVALLEEELSRFATGQRPRLKDHLFIWDLLSLRLEMHPFLPVPGCPACNPLPEDRPELAMLSPRPRMKPRPEALRVAGPGDDPAGIEREVVSSWVGIIHSVTGGVKDSLAIASAQLPVPGSTRIERGVGRATTVTEAKHIAVLEALERYAGLKPGGKQPTLRTSYRELGEQAFDPRQLILFSPEQYAAEGFPFAPFDEDREHLWVWAYSFRQQRAVAIPEEFVYYGFLRARGRNEGEALLVHDLSNGCALGNCPEEAILHGLLEVLERDAFLLTWYARQKPHRLDVETVQDRRIPLLVDSLLQRGYETFVFNITQEFGVPTV